MTKNKLHSISVRAVDGITRGSIPEDHDEIISDTGMSEGMCKSIKLVEVYYRDPRDCPFARGNWIVDVHLKDGSIFCVKLPKEMSEEKVMKYCSPFIEKMNPNLSQRKPLYER